MDFFALLVSEGFQHQGGIENDKKTGHIVSRYVKNCGVDNVAMEIGATAYLHVNICTSKAHEKRENSVNFFFSNV